MKTLIILILIVVCSGCMTTYSIEKNMQDGSSVTVLVQSWREFEQPQVHYNRTDDSVTFDFGAKSATTGRSPIEEAFAKVIVSGGTIGATVAAPLLSQPE